MCPVCGDNVPPNALACPECGADHNSGWKEDACDGLDLPNDDFDYDKFVEQEFGSPVKPPGMRTWWWITAIILIVLFVAIYLHAVR